MHKIKGFTLIELSIVLLIVGLLIAGAAQAFNLYIAKTRLQETKTNLGQIHQALENFVAEKGRMPCPSPLGAAVNTPAYGNEDCSTASGSMRVAGARDTAADADAAFDPVLIGTIPIRTLSLPDGKMVDGYRHRFQYVVTESMTDVLTFNKNHGVLNLIDGATPPNSVAIPPNTGTYIVYSLGQKGAGGYSVGGIMGQACEPASKDGENCDNNNATFIKTDQRSTADGPVYFDDIFDYTEPEADNIMPSGAVMAFDLAACPKGWTPFGDAAGRTVIGTGSYQETLIDPAGNPSPTPITINYALRQKDGKSFHTLNVNEMPPHSHGITNLNNYAEMDWIPRNGGGAGGFMALNGDGSGPWISQVIAVLNTGNGAPHENRQPSVALTYCRKD